MIRAILRLFTSRRRRWRELFSLAIDERLSGAEAAELQRILDRWPEARKELDAMREAVTALRAAPQVEPRRSFRLTPDMVEETAPEPVRRIPAFVPAAAGAAALLVFAIIGGTLDLFDGGPSGQESPPLAVAPLDVTAAPAPTTALRATEVPEATSMPAATSAMEAIEPRATAMPEPTATPMPTPEPMMIAATAMPEPTPMSEPTATPEAMMVVVTATPEPEPTPAPAATSAPTATSRPTATSAAAVFVKEEPTTGTETAVRAADGATSETVAAVFVDEPTGAPEPTAVVLDAVTPTTAPAPTATPAPAVTAAPAATAVPTATAAPTAAVVLVAATPTVQGIETDVATLDPGDAEGNVAELESVIGEYVDANEIELRAPQGPPDPSGADGMEAEDGEPRTAGPRDATGGEGPEDVQREEGRSGTDGADGVAGPQGPTAVPPVEAPPPEPDGDFPWLPLQIVAAIALAASLAAGAWSYLRG